MLRRINSVAKKRNIVLTDASKFGQIYPTSFGEIEKISLLITTADAPQDDLDFLRNQGVEVLVSD
ncbi:MAG: hypothetical protein V7782_12675 [Psychromonas sp.]